MVRVPRIGKWCLAFSIAILGPALASAQREQPQNPRDEKRPGREGPVEKNPREQLEQMLELKKMIEVAMQARDQEKVQDLIQKLQKMMLDDRGALQLQIAPQFPGGRDVQPQKSDLRQQYEKQLKEFADSIDKLKDDKEAREAIEKARDEYKKAMEVELKKADEEQAKRPQPQPFPLPVPNFRPIPFPAIDFDGRNPRLNGNQPRLGVSLEKPSAVLAEQLDLKPDMGIVILDVLRGMPAEKAGLKKNDILLQWAGKDLPADIEAFQAMINGAKGGQKIEAIVLRKGKKETIQGIELPEVGRRGGFGLPGAGFNQLQTQINGTTVKLNATADGVKYDITGELEGRRITPSEIVIYDGDDISKYATVEKVPEKYQATVLKLVNRLGRQ